MDKKLDICNKKYSEKELLKKVKETKNIWEKELSLLIRSVPDFSVVFSDISKNLRG